EKTVFGEPPRRSDSRQTRDTKSGTSFAGAHFGREGKNVQRREVSFKGAMFTTPVSFEEAVFDMPIAFDDACLVNGALSFRKAIVKDGQDLSFHGVHCSATTTIDMATDKFPPVFRPTARTCPTCNGED